MDIEAIRTYCLAKEDVTESFPFGESALVFKTAGKMFLLLMLDEIPTSLNVKCDPEKAVRLRESFDWVLPGYHMNKRHWNTIIVEPALNDKQLKEWINDSYELVRLKNKRKA